jgi:hypothetical protein
MTCGRPALVVVIVATIVLAASGELRAQDRGLPVELVQTLQRFESDKWEERRDGFVSLLSYSVPNRRPGESWAIPPTLQALFKRIPQSQESVQVALIRLCALETAVTKSAAIGSLTEDYMDYRGDLLGAVAGLRDTRAIPVLVENIRRGRIVVEGLASFGDVALSSVVAQTKAAESPARAAAYLTLAEMLEPKYADRVRASSRAKIKAELVQGIRDSVYGVRISVVQGLAKLPGDDVTGLLRNLATSDPFTRSAPGQKPEYPVRNAAAKALLNRPKLP